MIGAAIDPLLMGAVFFAKGILPRVQRNKSGGFIITSSAVKQPVDGGLVRSLLRTAFYRRLEPIILPEGISRLTEVQLILSAFFTFDTDFLLTSSVRLLAATAALLRA
jgi:hypothetical protein